jgi:hypothetical protein
VHSPLQPSCLHSEFSLHIWMPNRWPWQREHHSTWWVTLPGSNVSEEWLWTCALLFYTCWEQLSPINYLWLQSSPERTHISLLASRITRIILAEDRVWMERDEQYSWHLVTWLVKC